MISTRDEILLQYAQSQGLIKIAESNILSNVLKALGLGAIGFIGVGSSPLWITLASIGLVAELISAISITDDNIKDLIERLEALDYSGTEVDGLVSGWINSLKQYEQVFKDTNFNIGTEEASEINSNKILILAQLTTFLKQMEATWPSVKPKLKDWKWTGSFGDIGEAETAIKRTSKNVGDSFDKLQKIAQSKKQEIIRAVEKPQVEQQTGIMKIHDIIVNIQTMINYLSHENPIKVDGDYGNETYSAILKLEENNPEIKKELDSKGITEKVISDAYNTKRNINIINSIYFVLSKYYSSERFKEKQTETKPISKFDRLLNKKELTPEETDIILKNMPVEDPYGEKTNAFTFLRHWMGANSPFRRAELIHDAFLQQGPDPAKNWINEGEALVEYIVKRQPNARGVFQYV